MSESHLFIYFEPGEADFFLIFARVSKEYYAPALGGIMLSIGIRLSIDDFALAFKRFFFLSLPVVLFNELLKLVFSL